jgi:hypothetical protein
MRELVLIKEKGTSGIESSEFFEELTVHVPSVEVVEYNIFSLFLPQRHLSKIL